MTEPVYLDCAATTPLDPRVREVVLRYLDADFGNSGSRTHPLGEVARSAVEKARTQVAALAAARRSEVYFTSGATESNNLAIIGLADFGRQSGRMHLVASAIEHSAVLEPLQHLAERGFELTLVSPDAFGAVDAQAVIDAVRCDTLLVSVMQANNETGVLQPIDEIASRLAALPHAVYLHVDAAQGFGKIIEPLQDPRIDLLSISGHKLHAPKGVGALVARRRNGQRPPLSPLTHGGGQEMGLRPGTLPVPLIAGLGQAAAIAQTEAAERNERCRQFKRRLLDGLRPLAPQVNGDMDHLLPQLINLSIPSDADGRFLDAEAVIEATRPWVAISHGAACTTTSTTCSHVLTAMGLDESRIDGALRFSWYHDTPEPNWPAFVASVQRLRAELADRRPEQPVHRTPATLI